MREPEQPHSSHGRFHLLSVPYRTGVAGTVSSLPGLLTSCFPLFPLSFQQESSERS